MVDVLGEFIVAREDSQGGNSINQVKGLVSLRGNKWVTLAL